jgi:hypothetical protein
VTRAPRSASDRGTARITVYPDGPLIVRGEFVLEDLDEGQLPTGRLMPVWSLSDQAALRRKPQDRPEQPGST